LISCNIKEKEKKMGQFFPIFGDRRKDKELIVMIVIKKR